MGRIIIKDLFVKYENSIVLNKINEVIEDGMLYVLLGPSGSGKTTFLKGVAGLLFQPRGRVEINGRNIYDLPPRQMLEYHTNCGFVFQNSALISNLSIYDNLALYYRYNTNLSEKEIQKKIFNCLEKINFNDDVNQRPAALSMGERMLINIIRAISHNPEYIFWDNPFSSLDIINEKNVKNIIIDLKSKGKTMILVTTNIDFALSVADKIGVIYEGNLIDRGTPQEIINSKISVTQTLLKK